MKKILLLFVICAARLTIANAQTSKGNLFIGAGIGTATYSFGTYTFNYSSDNNKNQDLKNYAISLSPAFGVFLTSHFIFGGTFNADLANNSSNFVSSNSVIVTSKVITKNTTYVLGPFMRYYFFRRSRAYSDANTLLYLQFSTGLGSGSGNSYQTNYNQSNAYSVATGVTKGMFVYKAQVNIGISVFVAENIGIDIAAGYQFQYQSYRSMSNTVTTSSNGFIQNNPITYKASSPESGLSIAAGIHLFIRPN